MLHTLKRALVPLAKSIRCAASAPASELSNTSHFPGAISQFTKDLNFRSSHETFPVYQVMDRHGNVANEDQLPNWSNEEIVQRYKSMVAIHEMDSILYHAQRQGRISFYMTSHGEEAIHIGTASALTMQDVIYAQYREVGVLMHRGYTLDEVMNQCFSTHLDPGKGRQMPVHYGSKALNFQTISSPLGTQIPQASGAGYALRLAKTGAVCACYFGDGAASEGDFHAALNIAATTGAATIFICRNNGWAISTPTAEQYRGDGIAGRGPSYGIATLRADGNDIYAVFNATQEARRLALEGKPVLLEFMTYRRGHHSTSDDATRYRSNEEQTWWGEEDNPIKRLRLFLRTRGLWTEEEEVTLRQENKQRVMEALERADKQPKPAIAELFNDVFDVKPPHLLEQEQKLKEHLAKHPGAYQGNYNEA